jgi:hypothetical protein
MRSPRRIGGVLAPAGMGLVRLCGSQERLNQSSQ